MGIISTYKAYRGQEPQFIDWNERRKSEDLKKDTLSSGAGNFLQSTEESGVLQKKAAVVADSILLLDNYAQTKAEDVEAVFQTVQLELLAGLSAALTLPSAVNSLSKKLKQKQPKSSFLTSVSNSLEKYSNKKIKMGKFNVPVPKLLTAAVGAVAALIYVPTVKDAVTNQVGATARAKFEGMSKELPSVNDFAVLTPEQELEAKKIMQAKNANVSYKASSVDSNSSLVEFFNNFNVSQSINCVNELMKDKNTYVKNKTAYDESLQKNEQFFGKQLSQPQLQEAKSEQRLFDAIVKKVDVDSHDSLERIEKTINVGYCSLFAGGFLEYFLSKKIVDAAKIKNPIVKKGLGFGIPLVSYMVLNKNLASIQNDAIKATRYKKLSEVLSNPSTYRDYSQEQLDSVSLKPESEQKNKENIFKFLKGMAKDIKDYKEFNKNYLKEKREFLDAKRQIKLSDSQINSAKQLQKNTFMVINKVNDNNQKYSESIETLSELFLAPVELGSAALGTFVGQKLAPKKYKGIMTALGALVGFIPGALAEIYTTSQQRHALRIAGMLSSKELSDYRQFVNYDDKSFKQQIDTSFAFKSSLNKGKFASFE